MMNFAVINLAVASIAVLVGQSSANPLELEENVVRRAWNPSELPKLATYWRKFAELREGSAIQCNLRLGFYLRRMKFAKEMHRANIAKRSVASDRTDIRNGQSAVRGFDLELEQCRNDVVSLQPDTDPFYREYQKKLEKLERIENEVLACRMALNLAQNGPARRSTDSLDLHPDRRSTPQMLRVEEDVDRQIQAQLAERDACFEAMEIPANSMFKLTM